jgi:TonB family protein
MEPVHQRRTKNSTKVNLVWSLVFHGVIIAVVAYISARSGLLGHNVQEIFATIEKDKKPPEKTPPPKFVEPPKDLQRSVMTPPSAAPPMQAAAAPPAETGPTPVAPPPDTALGDAQYDPNASAVQSSTNAAVDYYKNWVEYTIRANWDRPTEMADDNYVAEVDVTLDGNGRITSTDWVKGSGNPKWDESVRAAISGTKEIDRPPPKGFPPTFRVRFDVVAATEPLVQ